MSKYVLLFRQGEDDKYERAIMSADFPFTVSVLNMSVLSTVPCNTELLRAEMNAPESYAGLIFTSPRAVECVAELANSKGINGWERWGLEDSPIYCVGPETYRRVTAMGKHPAMDATGVGGAECLAQHIIRRYSPSAVEKPFLFLCGNRRLDHLPALLTASHVPLQELVIYSTQDREDVELPEPLSPSFPPSAVVFFSPSSVHYANQQLRSLWDWNNMHKIAFGGSTAAEMERHCFGVSSIATEPSPFGVVQALKSCFSV
eukprot:GILK01008395.1.p1 GENE.GILK01008395.1~~GILK01008395.1.p1  ORF type:complete len:260 (+),score=15.77 GILK01008395.1:41-820(+)